MKTLAAVALTVVTAVACVMPSAADPTPAQQEPSTVEAGKKLRLAIDSEYRRMSEANQIRPAGQAGNPITAVIQPFIASGMPFAEAEGILRAAGFQVGSRTQLDVLRRSSVTAVIDRYPPGTFRLFNKVSVVVLLYPASPDNWSSVGSMTAGFVSVFL